MSQMFRVKEDQVVVLVEVQAVAILIETIAP
jgi:hypothetical protein